MTGRAPLGWLIGFTLVAIPVWHTVRDLDLRTNGVEAIVRRVDPPVPHTKGGPTAWAEDAGGQLLMCGDWDLKVGDRVLYDRVDQRRCRAAADIGWPNPPQWLTIGGGLLVLCLGVLGQLHEWGLSKRRAGP